MTVAELAVVLGLLNAVVVLARPIGRIHSRIDRLEFVQGEMAQDIAKILGASGITASRKAQPPEPKRRWL